MKVWLAIAFTPTSLATGMRCGLPRTTTGSLASNSWARGKGCARPMSCDGRRSSGTLPGLIRATGNKTCSITFASPTCFAVPVEPAAVELLRALVTVLPRWGRWYVFGAQAVVAYGVPRMSADIDVTIQLAPEEPERFATEMAAAGFSLRVDDPDFIRRTRVMPFVHAATAMPVDIVLAGSGLEEEFLERARSVDVGGMMVPLIDPSDLIVAKILAGRPKDIDDASTLWRLRKSQLDDRRILHLLQSLEEALGQSDLLRVFEAIRSGR